MNNKILEASSATADHAAQSAEQAIKSTQRAANELLGSLSDTVQNIHSQTTPALNRAGEQANAVVQRGIDAVRDSSALLRDKAQHASESTVSYIKHEPVKAMLIAAATGATLMVLITLMSRSRD